MQDSRKGSIYIVLILIVAGIMIFANNARAATGVCYSRAVKNSKHLYFTLEEGRKVLKDLTSLGKTKRALQLEQNLLTIEKRNTQILKDAKIKCEDAIKKSERVLKESKTLVADLKKQLKKAWEDIITLKGKIQRLKRSRRMWFMIGLGAGVLVAGGAAIALTAIAKDENQLRAGLMAGGIGGVTVGGVLIVTAIVK